MPANLLTYWEDCFYCDYLGLGGDPDFSKIPRRIAFEEVDRAGRKTGRWVPGNLSQPALPYRASLVWYPEEDLQDPWLRIEVNVHAP